MILLALVIALSSIDSVESARRARRVAGNSEEVETDGGKWSPRRRLSMADDEVVGFRRVAGATMVKIIGNVFGQMRRTIRAVLKFVFMPVRVPLQLLRNTFPVEEPEPEPPTMMSSIYDSLSNAVSGSNATTTKPITKSPSLRNQRNLPKATSRGALGKKSIMEDLVKGGSSSAFDSEESNLDILEDIQSYLPSTSRMASLLPTLVAGLVFTTAGTIVGFLWNTEWSSYTKYIWGEDGESTKFESDSFYDAATSSFSMEGHDEYSTGAPITTARVVTPGRF